MSRIPTSAGTYASTVSSFAAPKSTSTTSRTYGPSGPSNRQPAEAPSWMNSSQVTDPKAMIDLGGFGPNLVTKAEYDRRKANQPGQAAKQGYKWEFGTPQGTSDAIAGWYQKFDAASLDDNQLQSILQAQYGAPQNGGRGFSWDAQRGAMVANLGTAEDQKADYDAYLKNRTEFADRKKAYYEKDNASYLAEAKGGVLSKGAQGVIDQNNRYLKNAMDEVASLQGMTPEQWAQKRQQVFSLEDVKNGRVSFSDDAVQQGLTGQPVQRMVSQPTAPQPTPSYPTSGPWNSATSTTNRSNMAAPTGSGSTTAVGSDALWNSTNASATAPSAPQSSNPYNLPEDLVAGMTQNQQLQAQNAQPQAMAQSQSAPAAGGQTAITQGAYAPGEMVTTPGFTPAATPQVSGTGVLQDMEQQRQVAQQGNIDRYNQIMEGYGQRETDITARNKELLGMTEGWGKAQREQLATKFEKQGANLTQEMINRGMYNTGALDSARRGMDRDQQYQQLQMEDALNRQIMDYKRGLSNEEFANRDAKLQFMERVDEQGPTMDDAYKYAQAVGVGNADMPEYNLPGYEKPGKWTPPQGTGNTTGTTAVDVGSTGPYSGINTAIQLPNVTLPNQYPDKPFGEDDGGGGGTGGGGGGTGGGGGGTGSIYDQNGGTGGIGTGGTGTDGTGTETKGTETDGTGTGGTGTGGTSGGGGGGGTGGGKTEGPGEGTGEGGEMGEWHDVGGKKTFIPANITGGDFWKTYIAPELKRTPGWDWVSDLGIRSMAPAPLAARIDAIRAVRNQEAAAANEASRQKEAQAYLNLSKGAMPIGGW